MPSPIATASRAMPSASACSPRRARTFAFAWRQSICVRASSLAPSAGARSAHAAARSAGGKNKALFTPCGTTTLSLLMKDAAAALVAMSPSIWRKQNRVIQLCLR